MAATYPLKPLATPLWRMLPIRFQRSPLSGEGARLHGGRWNPRGTPALYLALDHATAVAEFYQGLAKPGTLAPYRIDATAIADLTDGRGGPVDAEIEHGCTASWKAMAARGDRPPPSWTLAEALIECDAQGALVPSVQNRGGSCLVLWNWHNAADGKGDGAALTLIDPAGNWVNCSCCDRFCRIGRSEGGYAERFLPGEPEDRVLACRAHSPGTNSRQNSQSRPAAPGSPSTGSPGSSTDGKSVAAVSRPRGLGLTRATRRRGMRDALPWARGRHPWLDAAVVTNDHLIGMESQRFEPFRSGKQAKLQAAYPDRDWGDAMARWTRMRDALHANPPRYRHLDAANWSSTPSASIPRHGCRTAGLLLLYLFAEPASVPAGALARQRSEIADFRAEVPSTPVRFASLSWRDWLATFTCDAAKTC